MSTFNFPSEVKEEITVQLSKNVNDVFNFIAVNFLKNYPKWSPEVDSVEGLSEGAFGVNYQFRQMRTDKKIVTESVLTVTDYEMNQLFGYANFTDHYYCRYLFADGRNSTSELTFTFDLNHIDLMMRPFAKLIRSAIRDGVLQTTKNIKHLIEEL